MEKLLVGVYKITCLGNNKIYVGSSSNIKMRWYRHISNLKYNKSNPNLQNSYNKYGKDLMKFEILEECGIDDLIKRETYWAEVIRNQGFELFNVGEFIDNPTRGLKLTENHKDKLRDRFKGEKNPSFQKIWIHKENQQEYIKNEDFYKYEKEGYKRGLTNLRKSKISIRQKELGRPMSEHNKIKLIESNKKPKSFEHKLKLSKSRIDFCGVKVMCVETKEIFDSLKDAADKFNTSYQGIRQSILRNGTCCKHHFIKI
jgi:group I intron endonuclease